jgi:hygromycin-B 4-O-kinase
MSIAKTKIDSGLVVAYIQKYFDDTVEAVEYIKGGESSQAYRFRSKERNLIIRVNTSDGSFKKDEYAFERFISPDLPIPEILHIGEDKGYAFAVSILAEGITVKDVLPEEFPLVLPEILSVLDTIHATDISQTTGFGKWDTSGIGGYSSWKDFVLSVNMYIDSGKLFETTFLERDVWNTVYGEMEQLTAFCPETRFLVHGDYGSDNLMTCGGKITGVLDWAESLYGDFLYDVAWLSFWGKEKSESYEKPYSEKNIPNFKERMLCYKLRIGLGSLSFFAYSQQKEKYDIAKERLLKLI